MSALSIRPPFSEIHIEPLKRTPLALFQNDAEVNRGRAIEVNICPTGGYLAVLVIDVGGNEVTMLGYNPNMKCWVPVKEDLASGNLCQSMDALEFDIRHVLDLVPATPS
jgi:hypothetical protein